VRLFLSMRILFILLLFSFTAQAFEIQESEILKKLAASASDAVIAVYPSQEGVLFVSDTEKANKRTLPASTFKIPHALAAIDSGIVPPDTLFKWDEVKRDVEAWNRDMTLAQAMSVSAVWVFEEVGRRLGQDVLNVYVSAFDYGNKDISGEYPFWLKGNLKISPIEQIKFIEKFNTNYFRLSKTATDYVKDAMLSGSFKGCTVYAKTGWAGKDRSGWYTGFYDCPDEVYYFAVRITIDSPEQLILRQQLTERAMSLIID